MRCTAVSQPSGELMAAWCCIASSVAHRGRPAPPHSSSLCSEPFLRLLSARSLFLCQSQCLHFSQFVDIFFSFFPPTVLTLTEKRHSCIFYLTWLTNMYCSREGIDFVNHSEIWLPRQLSSRVFAVQPPIHLLPA